MHLAGRRWLELGCSDRHPRCGMKGASAVDVAVVALLATAPTWTASAAAAAPKPTNCTLSALQVWCGGCVVQLQPEFSADVTHYRAVADLHCEIWAEVKPGDGARCQAMRSDGGVPAQTNGELAIVAGGTAGEIPRVYAVELSRRSSKEAYLEALELLGDWQLFPAFHADALQYSVTAENREGELALSCGPRDMGQGLRVSLRSQANGSSHMEVSALEVPMDLKHLLYRRRNYSLGQFSSDSSGALLTIPRAERSQRFRLPLVIKVEVWPASAAVSGEYDLQKTTPGRVYSIELQAPSGHRHSESTQVHEGSLVQRQGIIKALLVPVVLTSILGLVLAFMSSHAAILNPESWASANRPRGASVVAADGDGVRGRAESEVERAFNQARGVGD